jgi:hypothetical protein
VSDKDLDDPEVGIIAQDIGTLDLSGYGAAQPYDNVSYSGYGTDTITIDTSTMNSMYSSGTITLPTTTITNGGYTIGHAGSSGQFYTTGINGNNWNNVNTSPSVNISSDGIEMAAGTDIKVDGKSLKEFMNKMEERLAILVPDPSKLEKFEALKKAYEHYKLMESLCQESPKEEE